jgi:hypothetical integral membrane protein (TIGR02206 family)
MIFFPDLVGKQSMENHVIMEPMTPLWWACIATVVGIITLLVILPFYAKWARHPYYPRVIASFLIINLLIENSYALWIGSWSVKNNLPLHLCGISSIIGMILMFRFNAALAQVFYYFGLTGGIHSMLTPEFDLGDQGFFFYSYFITHGSLLLVCTYMIVHHRFKPEKNSWLKTFMVIQAMALLIGLFNWSTGANYMFLSSPPIVDNPLIIGSWPWYILVFEGLALAHFFMFYKLFRLFK